MFIGKEIIDKKVDIKKNEFGNVNYVCVEETYSEDEGTNESVFYYLITKNATQLIQLSDNDIYSKISIKHENPIDYKHFHEQIMKVDLALKLIDKKLEDFVSKQLSEKDENLLRFILKNIKCISEEEYNKQILENS